jgi:hypothetical protein
MVAQGCIFKTLMYLPIPLFGQLGMLWECSNFPGNVIGGTWQHQAHTQAVLVQKVENVEGMDLKDGI